MATNVVMPKMGESITEGTILGGLKKEGDAVQRDEPILEISTDKVDTEVPSPVDGILLKILAQEQQTISVGEPIASMGVNGEAVSAPSAPKQAEKAPESPNPSPQPVVAEAPTPAAKQPQ